MALHGLDRWLALAFQPIAVGGQRCQRVNYHCPVDLSDTTGLSWRVGILWCLERVQARSRTSPPPSVPVQEPTESTPVREPTESPSVREPTKSAPPERLQESALPECPIEHEVRESPPDCDFPNISFFGGGYIAMAKVSHDPPDRIPLIRHGRRTPLTRHGRWIPLTRHGRRSPRIRHGRPSALLYHGSWNGIKYCVLKNSPSPSFLCPSAPASHTTPELLLLFFNYLSDFCQENVPGFL